MPRKALTLLGVIVLATLSCTREPLGDKKPVVIRGSQNMRWLSKHLADRYVRSYPGRDVEVHGGGSRSGLAALAAGEADIAVATRRMHAAEREKIELRRGRVTETVLALESAVIFVNPENPVDTLTLEQIHAIFTGHTQYWSEVGGARREPIRIIDRYDTDGSYDAHDFFKSVVLQGADVAHSAEKRDHTYRVVNAVAIDAAAIGYGRPDQVNPSLVRIVKIKTSPTSVVAYSEDSVIDRTYPFVRPIVLYSVSDRLRRTDDFVKWCRSKDVETILRTNGFLIPRSRVLTAGGS